MTFSEPKFFKLLRDRAFSEAHTLLDSEQNDLDVEHQHNLAHWRLAALNREKRYEEALDHLDRERNRFLCQTTAYQEKARILTHLGRLDEAKQAIDAAPFESERDKFPGLVQDAQFLRLYIHAITGLSADHDVDSFPEGFVSLVPDASGTHSRHMTAANLLKLFR